jgi:dihydrolipoamide dehydrogenase
MNARDGNVKQLIVIGGGVGGYTAAIRAARAGVAVTLIENGPLGGTCLNVGCIPTKSLLHQTHVVDLSRAQGLIDKQAAIEFSRMAEVRQQAVARLVQGVQTLVRRNRITLVAGTAAFVDARTVRVRESGQALSASHFVIATGSVPVMPNLEGATLPGVITSDGALALNALPKRVAIIGGGVIGVEFAQIFATLGCETTIIEMRERLLAEEDADVAAVLQDALAHRGVAMKCGASVRRIVREGEALAVETGSERIIADRVLVAVGRKPVVDGIGLKEAGVSVKNGAIVTDAQCRTSAPGIYAVGDARGGLLLAHKAGADAECAIAHLLGRGYDIETRVIPRAVYTAPEVAAVGLTEAAARAFGSALKIGKFPFAANGKAITGGETEGFVKVIADGASGQILGIGMVGPAVTHLLGEATLAVQMELTLDALAETVHAHPTLSEALMEAAHDALDGGAIHLPPRAAAAAA